MLESHSKYWYGGSLNRKSSYPNLLKKDLKSYSKNKLESIYQSYHEYYDNLYWEYEKDCEYKHFKNLKNLSKERERTSSNLSKIEEIYNSKYKEIQ